MTENEQSYEQIYSQINQQPQEEQVYQNQLMLDENDQIQLYANEQRIHHTQNTAQIDYNSQIIEEKQSSPILNQLSQSNFIANSSKQQLIQQDLQIQQVIDLLKNKYGHFNQQILIKMLHDSLSSPSIQIIPKNKIQIEKQSSNVQQNFIFDPNERKDFDDIKNLNKTVKIFIEHGYGINIARKFATKGQKIQPNPYNNTIGKIINKVWKAIENQIIKTKKSLKPLTTEKFNQIKTPLLHSKRWMDKEYNDIFNNIISYIHGLKTQKPSLKKYQDFYNYVIQKAKNKKNKNEKRFYKNSNKTEQKYIEDSSSEEFKPSQNQKFNEEKYNHLTQLVKNSFKKVNK